MVNKGNLLQSLLLGFIIISAMFFSASGFAAFANNESPPLKGEEAFVLSTSIKSANEVDVKWHIAPGYYLYQKHIHIKADPNAILATKFPKAEIKKSPHKGQYEVYSGELNIPVMFAENTQKVALTVEYQGCSKQGFCYPPMSKTVSLELSHAPVIVNQISQAPTSSSFSLHSLMTSHLGVQSIMQSNNLSVMLLLFLGLGVLLAFTPCVLPMIPILTGIIVGQKQQVTTKKALSLSFTYILGTSITYAAAGVFAAAMGSSLQTWLQQPWVIGGMSSLFFLLALSLFGFYHLSMPRRLQNRIIFLSNKQQGGTYVGVFSMGILSTLIVSPCVTAPLVGVLMYIGETGNMIFGASALFVMGLGMGIPLMLVGVSAGRWLPKNGPWMEAVKKSCGFIMIGVAIWLLSRILNPSLIAFLWGGLLVGIALFLAIYLPKIVGKRLMNRMLGSAVGLLGMSVIFVGGMGVENPMANWMPAQHNQENMLRSFVIVRSMDDFNRELSKASEKNRPVILDFYADWCESCVAMDNHVFNTPKVQSALASHVLLRIDLSQNTQTDEALMKQFNVFAPPTILFFDQKGHEVNKQRIVGEVTSNEFLSRLSSR